MGTGERGFQLFQILLGKLASFKQYQTLFLHIYYSFPFRRHLIFLFNHYKVLCLWCVTVIGRLNKKKMLRMVGTDDIKMDLWILNRVREIIQYAWVGTWEKKLRIDNQLFLEVKISDYCEKKKKIVFVHGNSVKWEHRNWWSRPLSQWPNLGCQWVDLN